MNKTILAAFFLLYFFVETDAQTHSILKVTLPPAGKFKNDKPAGKGWVNLLDSSLWNNEEKYWQFANGLLHGESENEKNIIFAGRKKCIQISN